MQEIHQGSMELESGDVDMEDIEQAYETGQDDKQYKTGTAPAAGPQQPAPGALAPGGAPNAQQA
jgi:hypothetical protein